MFTLFNSTRSFVQIPAWFENNSVKIFFQKHAKITAIALVAIASLTAIYLVIKNYRNRKEVVKKEQDSFAPNEGHSNESQQLHLVSIDSSTNKSAIDKSSPFSSKSPNDKNAYIQGREGYIEPQKQKVEELFQKTLVSEQQKQENELKLKELQQKEAEAKEKLQALTSKQTTKAEESTSQVESTIETSPTVIFFKKIDIVFDNVMKNLYQPTHVFSVKTTFNLLTEQDHENIRNVLNQLILKFEEKYSIDNNEKIGYGQQVPSYFANVKDHHSNEYRKYLSLIGIRNLLKYGPKIVDDFRNVYFLGGEHHYNPDAGLNLFKAYTGNLVDLDTEFDAKNDFEAIEKAKELIIKFGKDYGCKNAYGSLKAEDVNRQLSGRKLDLPLSGIVHTSDSNTDRSNYGIWKRGQKYYVNVPNVENVVVATLKLPYLIAEIALLVKEKNHQEFPQDFLDDFFDNGISDMCFNDKLRKFNDFYIQWEAKLKGSLSLEDDARKKIAEGFFGEVLKLQNPDHVIKQTKTRTDLINFLEEHEKNDQFNLNGLNEDAWIDKNSNICINILIDRGIIFDSCLYRTDKDSDYFLWEKNSFNLFMKAFYTYIRACR